MIKSIGIGAEGSSVFLIKTKTSKAIWKLISNIAIILQLSNGTILALQKEVFISVVKIVKCVFYVKTEIYLF